MTEALWQIELGMLKTLLSLGILLIHLLMASAPIAEKVRQEFSHSRHQFGVRTQTQLLTAALKAELPDLTLKQTGRHWDALQGAARNKHWA